MCTYTCIESTHSSTHIYIHTHTHREEEREGRRESDATSECERGRERERERQREKERLVTDTRCFVLRTCPLMTTLQGLVSFSILKKTKVWKKRKKDEQGALWLLVVPTTRAPATGH